MLNKKEIFSILLISLVLGTIISVDSKSIEELQKVIIPTIGIVALVILINVISKKVTAHYFDSEVEIRTWEFQRMLTYNPFSKKFGGYRPHEKMKSKFAAGFFIPLIIKVVSFGLVNWMASLTFEVKGTIYRARRKFGMYQYAEVTEDEMAWIAFIGIMANIFFAILGYLINAPMFSKINLMYAFYNTIPLSDLDGTKMIFGRIQLWWIAAIISSIGLVMSMVIV